ncbi:zinc finger protein [Loa loa]|uniref:Zinc finger protein n=1 Tax=Loa loa TaxID=7209 RepID=A0A1I7V987_LOALO|nr:zinc finger protein [Loa loa]EJD73816.1 zinc finger protein [Loa loa]
MQKTKPNCGKVSISFGAVRQHLENIRSRPNCNTSTIRAHTMHEMESELMSVHMSDVLFTRTVAKNIENTEKRTANDLFTNVKNPIVENSTIIAHHFTLTRKNINLNLNAKIAQILQPQVQLEKTHETICFITSR